jgi:hypothetical protein
MYYQELRQSWWAKGCCEVGLKYLVGLSSCIVVLRSMSYYWEVDRREITFMRSCEEVNQFWCLHY